MKTKKLLSVILTVVMLLSAVSVCASAINADYEIKYGETITVKASAEDSEDPAYVKFVPEKDGKYMLKSESDDIDPYCSLISGDNENQLEWADDENGADFILVYEFEAGTTYYFIPCVYGEETQEYKITLVCGHTYSEGICSTCGAACKHTEIEFLGFCPCGKKYIGKDIKDGDEITYDAEEYNNESGWYRFIPEVSGAYCLEDITGPGGASDSACIVYDADGEWLSENHDADFDAGNYDFKLIYGFEAGKTYYFELCDAYEGASFDAKLSRVTHTADDGSVHYVDYAEYVESTCIEHGYSEGLYCPDCEKYISGHEELELSDYHNDENYDNVCDDCGIQTVYCDHLCHSDHWFVSFFWRIVQFFLSLFNIAPFCGCGAPHFI